MPGRNSRCDRAEPTAPPSHLMPDDCSSITQDRNHYQEPPPTYDEAISDGGQVTGASPQPAHRLSGLPSSTSQEHTRNTGLSNTHESHHRDFSSSPSGGQHRYSRQSGNISNTDNQVRRRYRSASPADGARDGSQEPNSELKKKQSSRSKIKKGLENIAFFIIQILD